MFSCENCKIFKNTLFYGKALVFAFAYLQRGLYVSYMGTMIRWNKELLQKVGKKTIKVNRLWIIFVEIYKLINDIVPHTWMNL